MIIVAYVVHSLSHRNDVTPIIIIHTINTVCTTPPNYNEVKCVRLEHCVCAIRWQPRETQRPPVAYSAMYATDRFHRRRGYGSAICQQAAHHS